MTGANAITIALAWIWLVCWPAWRMRPASGGWLRGLWKRLGRTLLLGFLLSVAGTVLASAVWPTSAAVFGAPHPTFTPLLFPFLGIRLAIVSVYGLRRRTQRRLRWQLTASHLAVIVLSVVPLTALAAAIGVGLVLAVIRPDAQLMAQSAVQVLRLSNVAPTRGSRQLQATLDAMASGTIALRGAPAATALLPNRSGWPQRVMVVDLDGRVIAAAIDPKWTQDAHLAGTIAPLPAAAWQQLRRQALAGQHGEVTTPQRFWTKGRRGQTLNSVDTVLGAAPIVDAAGHPAAVAVVQAPDVTVPNNQIVSIVLAVFGFSTIVVIALTAVPILLLSALFGYLMARGMTRRLEAVSRVTTAIASGDLTQRAPVNAENEVGQLAGSVNRMAGHLEKTMSELEQARAQAVEALRARQELVANISHELRTPLAVIRAHLDTLSMRRPVPVGTGAPAPASVGTAQPMPASVGAIPPASASAGAPPAASSPSTAPGSASTDAGPPTSGTAQESEVVVPETTLRALQNETERLASLVEDLFTLSRAQTGELQTQVRCEPVDVAVLVGDVAGLMRPLAQREGGITLLVQAAPGLPPALVDPDRLRQILENLVRNAVRHTPEGGIIVLSVAAQAPWVVVSVADTGEGIPPEHLPHIFERFYRVDQARTRSSGGAGLGLAIVREFVELMGGRVTAESTVGEGSCFRVYLPQAGVATPASRPAKPDAPIPHIAPGDGTP